MRPHVPLVVGTGDDSDDEYEIDKITSVKIGSMPGLRGTQLQFLVHFADESIAPVWHRLFDVKRTIALQDFMATPKWLDFVKSPEFVEHMHKYPARVPTAN